MMKCLDICVCVQCAALRDRAVKLIAENDRFISDVSRRMWSVDLDAQYPARVFTDAEDWLNALAKDRYH